MNMFLFADVEKKMVPNLKQIQKEIKGLYLLSRFVFTKKVPLCGL
jgi:hypothetical protein